MSPAEVLAFERVAWRHAGRKEAAIRETFGVTPVRYYQRLRQVLADPEALAVDAVTVARLRRVMRVASSRRADL